jgi:hypothetical protein
MTKLTLGSPRKEVKVKPVGLLLFLTVLLAMPFSTQAVAAEEAWSAPPPVVKVTAILTYTDTGAGKTVTKSYKPVVTGFKIARGYTADLSDNKTTFTLAAPVDPASLSITASTFGTGMKTGLKTDFTGVWDHDQEDATYPAFSFSDTTNSISMDDAAMISSSSQGSYTENTKDSTIVVSMKYTITGTVTATGGTFPAKLVVQITGSKIPKVAP